MLFNKLLKYPVFILLITGYFISLYFNIPKDYTICIYSSKKKHQIIVPLQNNGTTTHTKQDLRNTRSKDDVRL